MSEVAKVLHLPTDGYADSRPRKRPADAAPASVSSLTDRRIEAKPSLPEGIRRDIANGVSGAAAFLRRRITGDYRIDDFGYDQDFADSVLLPALRPLFQQWFRVEVSGIENIPDTGGALIVANHAGVVAWDALMLQVAVRDKHRRGRRVRPLAADLSFETPVVGTIARKAGATLACRADADRLLRAGELTAVFPEGYKGTGKPFAHRYRLQRFGRGGFVSSAVQAGVPIVPCSIVGSEETYPMLADLAPIARLLGLPYFPLTPLFPHLGPLGMVPLPSKWHVEFGEPIETSGYDPESADDPMLMFEVTDQVRETIQQTLYKLLARRRNIIMG
ncbi:MAG: acyltransferase family protein [Mycobacteriaceae bacterium]|nr:acyltransferase family protein [Mycobacteriaceae bacterium]